ncbi:allophanate hydrolase [Marinobacter fuscus]|uniref:Allophanate hydrolase n=1 Tax=Marinobacter fuscus TaxID=2109942 RepID=A0A2T1K409_9GAMM|nr:biotin-dependent carboxyltransferase family protein [Marinobacter fuscus]PSF04889.1 allophanate hydrolase [Marinobacter fuscus]
MSSESAFQVLKSGPLASLQDAGRYGVRHLGITQGGAADLHAWAWANWLAGNSWGRAVLEVTFGGLSLQADQALTLALTGADLGVTLDGEAIAPWASFKVRAGQTLAFSTPKSGLRAYLAVAGGFFADPVLGSLSGVARERLGGHDGQGSQLKAGDELRVDSAEAGNCKPLREMPSSRIPDYRQPPTLEFVLGAQSAEFTGISLFNFFNRPWVVDNRSDRMGIRLQGPKLSSRVGSMVSEGLALGAVQVPPDGQPIVLLNDRQTIGGYPRLGTLPPLACSRLAQCLPGGEVRFRPVSLERAHHAYLEFSRHFR